mmetsp:Transcript_33440/g.83372  ORF Transcript_33440/g.83372 Transcript_33440/m.83372 type:complete len:272 (+) Transcript_33440:305-1120(+)
MRARVGEDEGHVVLVQLADQIPQDLVCARVNGVDRGAVHQHVRRLVALRRHDAQSLAQRAREEFGVRKVQRRVEAADQDVRGHLRRGVARHVAENVRALQAAEDNPAGARGAHHQQTERRGQAHDQTHLHVEDRRDEEGDDPKREVSARAAPQQLSSGEVDERLQCREDDGCQHGEGQRAEEGREPQQHKHDHSRLYNAVHRCATPERGDQCRAREGAGDGKSVEQPAEKVGEAERNELLVALNRVSVLNAEDTGHRHGDEKAGEGDDRRA